MGRTTTGAVLKPAIAFFCLFAGVLIETALWDEQIMQSPDELTVTEFEVAEEGLSAVLTNAIEDQKEVVEWIAATHQARRHMLESAKKNRSTSDVKLAQDGVRMAAEMQFRAMRVLGLLEATREREAGRPA